MAGTGESEQIDAVTSAWWLEFLGIVSSACQRPRICDILNGQLKS